MNRLIDLELKTETVWLSCSWDAQIVGTIKTIPGREYHKSSRRWSVPMQHIAVAIARLEPLHFKFTPRMREWWKANREALAVVVEADPAVEVDRADGYSVSRLNEEARNALIAQFGGEIWVVAEIDGFDKNGAGHAYFELVERTAGGGQSIARVRAVLFASVRERLNQELPDGYELRDGLRLRLRGRVELYTPSGSFQLVVQGVDVDWAVGARRRKRDEILEQLAELGVANRNLERVLPVLPLRVGLVTALDSDAYNDFAHELSRSCFSFRLTAHAAKMQGRDAETSIVAALQWFAQHASEFDVVVVTRGGGSRGDLGYFDSLEIGRAVCDHPVKIISGIGHHRDRCVLDFVAHSEKTPTAAGRALVAAVERVVAQLERATGRIALGTRAALSDAGLRVGSAGFRCERAALRGLTVARQRCQEGANGLDRAVRMSLGRAQRRVDVASIRVAERATGLRVDRAAREVEELWARLGRATDQCVVARGLQMDNVEAKLRLADPRRIVERGFVIVRNDKGAVVKDAADLVELERATLQMRDAAVHVLPMEIVDG